MAEYRELKQFMTRRYFQLKVVANRKKVQLNSARVQLLKLLANRNSGVKQLLAAKDDTPVASPSRFYIVVKGTSQKVLMALLV